jgi:K+-sensing histidine kinase KdpD
MTRRLAGVLALIVFALCLVVGRFEAGNSFATTVQRALLAMAVTLVIGLVVGAMAERMLDENLNASREKNENRSTDGAKSDR